MNKIKIVCNGQLRKRKRYTEIINKKWHLSGMHFGLNFLFVISYMAYKWILWQLEYAAAWDRDSIFFISIADGAVFTFNFCFGFNIHWLISLIIRPRMISFEKCFNINWIFRRSSFLFRFRNGSDIFKRFDAIFSGKYILIARDSIFD